MAGIIDVGLDLGDVVKSGAELLGKFIKDKDAAAALAHEIATMGANHQHQRNLAQVQVNKQEAAHKSLLIAGWRPATGWVCVVALGFNYVLIPIIGPVTYSLFEIGFRPVDFTTIMPILLGMLGLGGMRSWEKKQGVARER